MKRDRGDDKMTASKQEMKQHLGTMVKGRSRIAYEGPYPSTFMMAAIFGGLGAVIGGIIGGRIGAAIGGLVGGMIGGYLGYLEDQNPPVPK